MKKLVTFSYQIIKFFWIILFGITLFSAVTSVNLILGDNDHFGTSTTLVTTTWLLVVLATILGTVIFTHFRQLLRLIFIEHKYLTSSLLLLMVITFQIFFVYYVHPVSGFDSGMLHYAATDPRHVQEAAVISYYSVNDNNLPIMLMMRWLVEISGQTSWLFFDYVTLVLVDLSALLNILTISLLKPSAVAPGIYFHCGWLAVFPDIIMPYTDAWVLPLVSLYLLSYFLIRKKPFPLFFKGAAVAVFGVIIVLTYFMKPSAIIPALAIAIIELLNWLQTRPHFVKKVFFQTVLLFCLLGTTGYATYYFGSQAIQKQNYIKLQSGRSIPAIHFMAIGVYGAGGYSEKQALAMVELPTKKQKIAYSKKMLHKRLKQLGVFGYLVFLVKKQGNNTADGTFGLLKEGHFFRDNQKPTWQGISNKLKNFIYLYGRNIADFRFLAQTWWVMLLAVIALGFGRQATEQARSVLQLALIGGFLFLLLFEGGRSRYMIQYLPVWLLLGSISWQSCIENLQGLAAWLNGKSAGKKPETRAIS